MNQQPEFFVGVYNCDRCYGGPEEGGWYYNHLTHVRSMPVESREHGRQVIKALCEAQEAPVDHSASIPEGDSPFLDTEGYIPTGFAVESGYSFFIERTPGDHRTTERPRYE